MITTEQIRKLIEDKKVTIGATETGKALTAGTLKTIVIASNAATQTRETLVRKAALAGVTVDNIAITNDDLGTMCKKPFAIQTLGIRK